MAEKNGGGDYWPDDTVEYRVYCSTEQGDDDGSKNVAATLSRLAVECNHAARQQARDHVWHYSPFLLRPTLNG